MSKAQENIELVRGLGTDDNPAPTDVDGANWAARDSKVFVGRTDGLMAITGFADNTGIAASPTETIGVSGFAIGNKASRSAWALYADVQFETGSYGYGIEIAVKNKEGVDRTSTPYFATTGTYGIWLPGGGDDAYGGSPTHPNNTAIAIGANSSTWNKGIVFFADGITGTDGTTGTGIAIELAKGHIIRWRTPGNYSGGTIYSSISTSSSETGIEFANNAINFSGTSGANLVKFSHQTSAVNYIQIINRGTGAGPRITATGTDTNIDLELYGTGTGRVLIGYASTAAATPANFSAARYLPIKDSTGTTYYLPLMASTW